VIRLGLIWMSRFRTPGAHGTRSSVSHCSSTSCAVLKTHAHVPSTRDTHVLQCVYRGRNARACAFPTETWHMSEDVIGGTDLPAVGQLPRQAAERMGSGRRRHSDWVKGLNARPWGVVETVHAGVRSGQRRRWCAPANLARPLAGNVAVMAAERIGDIGPS